MYCSNKGAGAAEPRKSRAGENAAAIETVATKNLPKGQKFLKKKCFENEFPKNFGEVARNSENQQFSRQISTVGVAEGTNPIVVQVTHGGKTTEDDRLPGQKSAALGGPEPIPPARKNGSLGGDKKIRSYASRGENEGNPAYVFPGDWHGPQRWVTSEEVSSEVEFFLKNLPR